jgi:hypothetical protein
LTPLADIGAACTVALVLSAKLEGRSLESVIDFAQEMWDAFRLVEGPDPH